MGCHAERSASRVTSQDARTHNGARGHLRLLSRPRRRCATATGSAGCVHSKSGQSLVPVKNQDRGLIPGEHPQCVYESVSL